MTRARVVVSGVLSLCAAFAACMPSSEEVVPTPAPVRPDPQTAQLCAQAAAAGPPMAVVFPGAFVPRLPSATVREVAPPAVSGGTLRVLADGVTAVAADPDRDRVYVVDLAGAHPPLDVALAPGDEPGRVVEDGAGRVHVALRGGGSVVTLDPRSGALLARRAVCAAPRGLALDAAADLIHVACASGELVTLPAKGGEAIRSVRLGGDLRDVVVDGPRLLVSRFRSAQVLTVEADGSVSRTVPPPAFRSSSVRINATFAPSVAWRMVAVPAASGTGSAGVAVLHQRALDDALPPPVGVGYYGGLDPCGAVVHGAVTVVAPDGSMRSGPALAGLVLPVDMAFSLDGRRVAVVSAGNATNAGADDDAPALPRVFVTDLANVLDNEIGCSPDGTHAPCVPNPFSGGSGLIPLETEEDIAAAADVASDPTAPVACDRAGKGSPLTTLFGASAQPIAVAFDGRGRVVVQSREPAALLLSDGAVIALATDSRLDVGHALFHANAGGFVACASCHPEGRDDGRVWRFTCEGPRRTQSLQTGIAGTEPFHWDGHEKSFTQLVQDVFVGRMAGRDMTPAEAEATLRWIDGQPRAAGPASGDPAAVARGRALFAEPARAACATCHGGARLTNNQSADVGTGGMFQVPSLVGIAGHAPYFHDGRAPTLRTRFDARGGGDRHGATSRLSASELNDLLAYLESL